MSSLFDPYPLGEAIAALIAEGEWQDAPIRASMLPPSGEIRPPMVAIALPALGFSPLGEGWDCVATEWPLHVFTGTGGEVDPDTHSAFEFTVLDALRQDPQLGGLCSLAYPLPAAEPDLVTIEGRQALRRLITIHIDH